MGQYCQFTTYTQRYELQHYAGIVKPWGKDAGTLQAGRAAADRLLRV